jgi:hypothetical protein
MDVSKLMNVRLNMVIVFSKLSAQLTWNGIQTFVMEMIVDVVTRKSK